VKVLLFTACKKIHVASDSEVDIPAWILMMTREDRDVEERQK
jgi:ribosomal protein L39E